MLRGRGDGDLRRELLRESLIERTENATLARADGEFVRHGHAEADGLSPVTAGRLRIEFRDRDVVIPEAGELLVVPRGTEHRPVAEPEANPLPFEPAGTRNTGDVESDLTTEEPERVDD